MSKSSFEKFINKKCVIKVQVHNEFEYIQGILSEVGDKSFVISQFIPYHNYIKKLEYTTLKREIFYEVKIKFVEPFHD